MGRLKFTIMGCGGSAGVPLGPNWWGDCDPNEPKNRRQRPSAFIQTDTTDILIDAGPDLRNQLVALDHQKIDYMLLTHEHSDHVAGMDDLRFYVYRQKKHLEISTLQRTSDKIVRTYPHMFEALSTMYPALFETKVVEFSPKTYRYGDVTIEYFEQPHGDITSLGIIIGDCIVYSTDCVNLSDETLDLIASKKPKVWIVDANVKKPHYTHSDIETTIKWIERVGAEINVLTHLGHVMDYAWLCERVKDVQPYTVPGHDGMSFEFEVDLSA